MARRKRLGVVETAARGASTPCGRLTRMSWSLKKKAQALLDAEQGTVHKDWGGKIAVALVYPNTYAVGMSNLGFQTIYRHLNARPDVVCERVFLPDPADLAEMQRTASAPFSLESQRSLNDFHMVGFSVTYEGDYINVLRLLGLAGIPLRATDRRPHDPLVLGARTILSCSWGESAPSPTQSRWRPSWTSSWWARARSWSAS